MQFKMLLKCCLINKTGEFHGNTAPYVAAYSYPYATAYAAPYVAAAPYSAYASTVVL